MKLSMTRDRLKDYLWNWEKGTVRTLEKWVQQESTRFSLYGRNMPRTPTGTCDPQQSETWNLTGYGSDAADLSLALRHGSTEILAYLARKVRYAMGAIPWWMDAFGKPPGEDSRLFGICGNTKDWIVENNNHGDTDIKRHFNAYGLLKAMVHPQVRSQPAAGWSDGDVNNLCTCLLTWIAGRRDHVIEHPYEYLRYANDIDTLAGIVEAARAIGAVGLANQAYHIMSGFIRWVFREELIFSITGADGTKWEDNNYGPMIERNGYWYEPFNYGWYPYGLQAWYRGHICAAMFHAAIVADARKDSELFALLVRIVDIQTRWLDPTRRDGAPLAPTAPGAGMFHNSVIQGGFVNGYLMLQGKHNTTLADWAALGEDDPFNRYAWLDVGWCADGGYWETEYRDGGGTVHQRKHVVENNIYTPGLPGLDTDNGYECVDGLWLRAIIYGDQDLMDMTRIVAFHHLAYCNSSDLCVTLGKALPNGIEDGLNKVGKPSRACHWARQCGFEFRAFDFGSEADGWSNSAFSLDMQQTPAQQLKKGEVQP